MKRDGKGNHTGPPVHWQTSGARFYRFIYPRAHESWRTTKPHLLSWDHHLLVRFSAQVPTAQTANRGNRQLYTSIPQYFVLCPRCSATRNNTLLTRYIRKEYNCEVPMPGFPYDRRQNSKKQVSTSPPHRHYYGTDGAAAFFATMWWYHASKVESKRICDAMRHSLESWILSLDIADYSASFTRPQDWKQPISQLSSSEAGSRHDICRSLFRRTGDLQRGNASGEHPISSPSPPILCGYYDGKTIHAAEEGCICNVPGDGGVQLRGEKETASLE